MESVLKPIKAHLKRFGLVAAALGMAFGHTASDFISSVVSALVMPVISLIIGIDDWQNHTLVLGSAEIKWGEVLKDTIRLIFVSFLVVFLLHWMNVDHKD